VETVKLVKMTILVPLVHSIPISIMDFVLNIVHQITLLLKVFVKNVTHNVKLVKTHNIVSLVQYIITYMQDNV